MSAFNFETASRQSAKGIIVIFGVSAFKVIKGSVIIFAALILKYFSSDKFPDLLNPKFIISFVGIIVFFLALSILRYLNFKFYVSHNYFFLQKGIFNKEEVSVSKTKIQNVYIKQNLLQQLINVVSLSIETAGDDKTEIEIMALSRRKAQALKSLLLLSVKENESKETDSLKDTVYFKASVKKLFLEGISENHFKSLLLIFAFIVGVYNDLKEFVYQFDLTSKFGSWFRLDGESFMTLLLLNFSIVGVLLVLAFLLSLVRMFVQNYNLTVRRKPEGLEISKGLFNKINLGLSSHRIQNTTVSTNRLKQTFGLYKLAFTQAMANKKQQLNFNIVGLGKAQISELLQQFYPKVEARLMRNKPSRYMMYRLLFRSVLIVLLLNVALAFGPIALLLVNIPLVIYAIVNAIYAYRKAYYHLDDDYIVVGSGQLIETKTKFLEIKKVQAVSLNQSIFQKRRDLASVVIYTASKPLIIAHVDLNTGLDIKNYLLFKVESENKDWM